MAEILIKAVSATSSDPEKDQRGCYKRGMPVVVMPDGHAWGRKEGLPNFVLLKLPGVSVERVRRFIEPDREADGLREDGNERTRIVRRRLWRIFVEDIPASVSNRWLSQGSITIGPDGDFTWTQFRNYLRNLRDLSVAPDTL